MPDDTQARGLIRVAPLLFVLLWSSSFVAARTGLRFITPLLFVAVRMTGCAVVLLVMMLVLRQSWRPLARGKWLHCAIAGALVNAVGLMAPHIGLLTTPSAQIALVQSLTPLLTAVLGVFLLREPLRPLQAVGLLLGVAGVGLVVGHAAFTSATQFHGLLLAFVGVLGIVFGTLYFGRFCRDVPLLPSAMAQFVAATVTTWVGAWLLETPHAVWNVLSIEATAWNTVMVSLGGMALYFLMLAKGSAARTSANFYLVPGMTALLAWGLMDEALTTLALAGLVVASIGCWLVNAGGHKTGRRGVV
jgi:drug/metabolite transporter (DMT)-like permease